MSQVVDQIRQFMEKSFRTKASLIRQMTEEDNINEKGILDSFEMIKLVAYLEKTFGLEISVEDFAAHRMDSLKSMEDYIGSRNK